MTTKAICMVNGIRLQKPSPKAFAVAVGPAPMASAARLTMRMARAANTQESGNQRSAQFEHRMAKRAERLSWMGRIAVIADSLGFIVIRRLRGRLCVLRLPGHPAVPRGGTVRGRSDGQGRPPLVPWTRARHAPAKGHGAITPRAAGRWISRGPGSGRRPARRRCTGWQGPSSRRDGSSRAAGSPAPGSRTRRSGGQGRWRRR